MNIYLTNEFYKVANSLAANASAIAIRIHTEKREIQIIDNGIGMTRDMLKYIGEYDVRTIIDDQHNSTELTNHTLTNIRRLSNTLTISSRYHLSTETFMKVLFIMYIKYLIKNITFTIKNDNGLIT